MKSLKKIARLFIVFACIGALLIPTAAAVVVTPQWENVINVMCTLVINDTTASCTGKVVGLSGISKMNGTLTLYKKVGSNWTYVTTWSGSPTTETLVTSGSTTLQKGYDYKAEYSVSVYRNGIWETVVKESNVEHCG